MQLQTLTFGDLTVIWAKDVADGQVKGFIVANDTPGFSTSKLEDKIALRIVQNIGLRHASVNLLLSVTAGLGEIRLASFLSCAGTPPKTNSFG